MFQYCENVIGKSGYFCCVVQVSGLWRARLEGDCERCIERSQNVSFMSFLDSNIVWFLLHRYAEEVNNNFLTTLDWLHEHACSRVFGLGEYLSVHTLLALSSSLPSVSSSFPPHSLSRSHPPSPLSNSLSQSLSPFLPSFSYSPLPPPPPPSFFYNYYTHYFYNPPRHPHSMGPSVHDRVSL